MVEEAKLIFLGYSNNDTNDKFPYEPPKNYDYWFGKKRNFRISRGFYPYYTDGYLWGRYEKENLTKWYEQGNEKPEEENEKKSGRKSEDCITREF